MQKSTGGFQHKFPLRYRPDVSWIILPIIALPFFIISFFNNPVGDDYWITSLVREHGYFPAQKILFNTVSARYSALAITGISPLTFGNFWFYKIIPLLFIFLFWSVIVYLVRSIVMIEADRKDIHLLSAAVVIIYLALMPGMGEGLYWVSSLACYQFGLLFFCWWLSHWIRLYNRPEKRIQNGLTSCTVLAAMLGFNELLNIIATGLILLVLAYRLYKRRNPVWELIMLVVAAISLYFLLNVGSFNHRYFSVIEKDEVSVLYAARFAFMQVGYQIGKVLLSPFLWIGILLITGPLQRLIPNLMVDLKWARRHLYFLLALWVGAMLMISFVTSYVNDDHIVPLRITNMIVFIFWTGLLVTGTVFFGGQPVWEGIRSYLRPGPVYILIGFLFLVGIILRNNFSTAITELVAGKLDRYEKQMQQRYELLKNCNQEACLIPYLKDMPSIIRFTTMDDEPHLEKYFRKKINYY